MTSNGHFCRPIPYGGGYGVCCDRATHGMWDSFTFRPSDPEHFHEPIRAGRQRHACGLPDGMHHAAMPMTVVVSRPSANVSGNAASRHAAGLQHPFCCIRLRHHACCMHGTHTGQPLQIIFRPGLPFPAYLQPGSSVVMSQFAHEGPPPADFTVELSPGAQGAVVEFAGTGTAWL